jgi:hypothetical protein
VVRLTESKKSIEGRRKANTIGYYKSLPKKARRHQFLLRHRLLLNARNAVWDLTVRLYLALLLSILLIFLIWSQSPWVTHFDLELEPGGSGFVEVYAYDNEPTLVYGTGNEDVNATISVENIATSEQILVIACASEGSPYPCGNPDFENPTALEGYTLLGVVDAQSGAKLLFTYTGDYSVRVVEGEQLSVFSDSELYKTITQRNDFSVYLIVVSGAFFFMLDRVVSKWLERATRKVETDRCQSCSGSGTLSNGICRNCNGHGLTYHRRFNS